MNCQVLSKVWIIVTHYQSKCSKKLRVPENFDDFKNDIQHKFETELGQLDPFVLYRVPYHSVACFSNREMISECNYIDLKCEMTEMTTSLPIPCVYILPIEKDLKYECGCCSDIATSVDSCISLPSVMCKKSQNWACMACGLNCNDSKSNLHASRILEVRECDDLTESEFEELLESCGLDTRNSPVNHIALCNTCHCDYFYTHMIAITVDDKDNYLWIVKDSVFDHKMPTSGTYGDIHGKVLYFEYPYLKPPKGLITHRLKRFYRDMTTANVGHKRKRNDQALTYDGNQNDKVAFIEFLRDAGVKDIAKIKDWIEIPFFAEQLQRQPPRGSDWVSWEQITCSPVPGVTAEMYFNKKTGILKYRMKGG